MAKRPTPDLDDNLDEQIDDELTSGIIYGKYMEDIEQILAQAYVDVEAKVRALIDDLSSEA